MTPSNLPEKIDPKDCNETDCHLKCSKAMTCMICGKRRFQSTDWRIYPIGIAGAICGTLYLMAYSAAYYNIEPYKSQNMTPAKFFAFYSVCIFFGIALPIFLTFYSFLRNKGVNSSIKCCYKDCSANLRVKGCSKCGHPPNAIPYIFFYFAGFVAIPSALYGACMHSSPDKNGLYFSLGTLGFIICATALLAGLIGLILREK